MGGVRGRATDRPALGDPVIRGFPSAEASRMGMHGFSLKRAVESRCARSNCFVNGPVAGHCVSLSRVSSFTHWVRPMMGLRFVITR